MIKCAIFDLDGTLVNTIDDLGNATDYVLEKYGKDKKWTISDYRMFVGDGAKKLIERAFAHTLSPDELENAYEMFKIKYQEILLLLEDQIVSLHIFLFHLLHVQYQLDLCNFFYLS